MSAIGDIPTNLGHRLGRGRLLGFGLYLLVALSLPSQWLFWDDIGFLLAAEAGDLDYGHLLYLPCLRFFHWLISPLKDSPEYAAKLFSMIGGALAFVLLWNRFERSRPRITALILALFVTATPFFWRQLSLVEPSTWTFSWLLITALAAENYGRRRGLGAMALLTACYGVTLGFHLASVFALPWLFWLARGPARAPEKRELLVPLALGLVALLAAEAIGDPLARIGAFAQYWKSFVTLGSDQSHFELFTNVLSNGAPVLTLLSLGALFFAWRGERGELFSWLMLGVPYLIGFLVFGRPVVGLLLPFTLAMGGVLATRVRAWEAAGPRITHTVLVLGLVGQGFVSMAFALHHATTPDEEKQSATLVAGALPENSVVIAGELAHHIRWHTDAPVVPAPNLMHSRTESESTSLELLHAECDRLLEAHEAVYVTNEAVDYLEAYWGIARTEFPQDDPQTIVVRENPPLALLLLAGRREGSRR